MSLYDEKPKPKRKNKPQSYRRTRIIILLLLIALTGAVGIYLNIPQPKPIRVNMDEILNPPDGDPFTPLCEFDYEVYFRVRGNNFAYVVRPTDNHVIIIPHVSYNVQLSLIGSPYIWGNGDQTQVMVNMETGNVTEIDDPLRYRSTIYSQTERYVLKVTRDENSIREIVIYDGESQSRILKTPSVNDNARWSVDDNYLLLYQTEALNFAQIVDMETLSFRDANLPGNVEYIWGWVDEEHILYDTAAGELYTWSILTGETKAFTDISFRKSYRAGGVKISPNVKIDSYEPNWIGGFDDTGTFHLFDVRDPDIHERISMNIGTYFTYSIHKNAIQFEYDTDPESFTLYYPNESMRSVDVRGLKVNYNVQLSPDQYYGLYREFHSDGELHYAIIQDFATNETLIMDADDIKYVMWRDVYGMSYIQYASSRENGTYVHYLLNPDTQERCKLGTFYADSLYISG